ncbi:MAG: amidohydrolase family protein [Ramlibacter sp.]
MRHDLVLQGGEVIDGSGGPRRAADVLVTGGLISGVVPPGTGRARDSLDATGKIVCPGFIDAHSHDDQLVLAPTGPHPKLTQGVCTVVTGNCGISLAPLVHACPPAPLDLLGADAYRFHSFADYLGALDQAGPQVNVVPLVGHTTLRVRHVKALQASALPHEIEAMREDLAQAMDAGAFGLSTGVYYPPAGAATTSELIGVASALKGRGAILATHLRDEGDRIDEALREAIEVASDCGAMLVLSHHKVVGQRNHGRTQDTLRTIEQAQESMQICLDCYPYEASSTMLSPKKAAQTPEVLITWSQTHPEYGGFRLADVAARWSVTAEVAAQRLMPGGAIYFSMAEEDVQRVLRHPLTMIGSDGLPHDSKPHPRLWGTFPRVLGHYSRDLKLMPLEAAVHKMTGLPASRFGLAGRGLVRQGHAADLVMFDPATVSDRATYANPTQVATGIDAVLVNGSLALWRGEATRARAGQRLTPAQHESALS